MIAVFAVFVLLQPAASNIRELFERNLARAEQEYGMRDPRTAAAARDLGLFLRNQNDAARARRALAEALAIENKPADAAELAAISPPNEAEALWERVSAAPDAALASRAFAALGELRERVGDRAGAAAFYSKALAKEEAASGPAGAEVAVRLNSLALVSDPSAAIPLLERAVAIDRKDWGEKHPETATAESNLSGELLAAGRVAESVRMGALALANFEATLGPDHPRTGAAASNLADAKRAAGDRAAAERLYRRALRIDEQAYGAANAETIGDAKNLAEFLREIGRVREAAEIEQRYSVGGRAH